VGCDGARELRPCVLHVPIGAVGARAGEMDPGDAVGDRSPPERQGPAERIALPDRSRQEPGDGAADPEARLEGSARDGLAGDLDLRTRWSTFAGQQDEAGRVDV